MMVVVVAKILLLLVTSVYASVTDIRQGIIKNQLLLAAFLVGLILNGIEWFAFGGDGVLVQAVNVGVMSLFSLLLYMTHVWAGGDCKLMIVLGSLVPYQLYMPVPHLWFSLVSILAFSFGFSYIYLLVDSVYHGCKSRQVISKDKFWLSMKEVLIRYVSCVAYIICVDQIIWCFFSAALLRFSYIVIMVNIGLVLIINEWSILHRKWLVGGVIIADVILIGITTSPIDGRFMLVNGFVVLFIIALKLIMNEYNYETIFTSQVREGMILSTTTTLLFSQSKVKGLPTLSTEDLRSRLTEAEAESVRRWEKSKYGERTVQIVRKIPFAVFIALGTILFMILGVVWK